MKVLREAGQIFRGTKVRVLVRDEVEVWFGGTDPDKKRRGFHHHTDGSGPR